MADNLVVGIVAGRGMSFGKLPHPVLGGAWGRGSEHKAGLVAASGGRGQCELDCKRSQDVFACQEQDGSRCVHASQVLSIDSVDVG